MAKQYRTFIAWQDDQHVRHEVSELWQVQSAAVAYLAAFCDLVSEKGGFILKAEIQRVLATA